MLLVLVARMASGSRFSLLLVQMFEMVRSSDKMIADLVATQPQLSSAIGLIVTGLMLSFGNLIPSRQTNKTRLRSGDLETKSIPIKISCRIVLPLPPQPWAHATISPRFLITTLWAEFNVLNLSLNLSVEIGPDIPWENFRCYRTEKCTEWSVT